MKSPQLYDDGRPKTRQTVYTASWGYRAHRLAADLLGTAWAILKLLVLAAALGAAVVGCGALFQLGARLAGG